MRRIFDVFVKFLVPEYGLFRYAILVDNDIPQLAFPDGHVGDAADDFIRRLRTPALEFIARTHGNPLAVLVLLICSLRKTPSLRIKLGRLDAKIVPALVYLVEVVAQVAVAVAHAEGGFFPMGGDDYVLVRHDEVVGEGAGGYITSAIFPVDAFIAVINWGAIGCGGCPSLIYVCVTVKSHNLTQSKYGKKVVLIPYSLKQRRISRVSMAL